MMNKMNILVSGGAGFIGSHLVTRLVLEGHNVAVVDDLSNGKKTNLRRISNRIVFLEEDVTEKGKWSNLKNIDVIYALHCHPRSLSFTFPQKDIKVNVVGMVNVMQLANRTDAKIIFASNSGIYGEQKNLPIIEKHADQPSTFYDINKKTVEEYLKLYGAFGLEYVIFRFATVYGSRQNVTEGWKPVIKHFLSQALNGGSIVIDGDGTQSRDFIYVRDIVDALVLALNNGEAIGETMILGTGKETSINSLYKTVCEVTGNHLSHRYGPKRLDDIQRMVYSYRKAEAILGWKPQFSLEDGIREMVSLE